MSYHMDEKVVVPRVSDYGPKPRSAKQALIQAHAFLAEEGQWVSGDFFVDDDPAEAYEKAACSSWAACSMGALGLVTGESPVSVIREWSTARIDPLDAWQDAVAEGDTTLGLAEWAEENKESLEEVLDDEYTFSFNETYDEDYTPLSARAAEALAKVIAPEYDPSHESAVDIVIQFNDHGVDGRTKVLDAFSRAIRSLGGEPLVDHRKVKNVSRYLARKRKAAKK